MELKELFTVGSIHELHPATDAWMQGDRFGEITKLDQGKNLVHVRMNVSRRLLKVHPDNILHKGNRNP